MVAGFLVGQEGVHPRVCKFPSQKKKSVFYDCFADKGFLLIDTFIVTANILESERTNPSICANLVFVLVGKLPFQKCAKSLPGL